MGLIALRWYRNKFYLRFNIWPQGKASNPQNCINPNGPRCIKKDPKMEIDHIFIFSADKGKEVDALVDFGFLEGSSRVHPGQGTVNRKIYFENFFLEIVWVHNEAEIRSENTRKTKLWERSNFLTNGNSPFGLGLLNTPDTNELFAHSIKYQPDYFPSGTQFDIITNEKNFYLPWTFRIPFTGQKKKTDEPMDHTNGIKKLTKATFDLETPATGNGFTTTIEKNSEIRFNPSSKNVLTLEFDNGIKRKTEGFEKLNLVIKY
jgi:hypothetical protein